MKRSLCVWFHLAHFLGVALGTEELDVSPSEMARGEEQDEVAVRSSSENRNNSRWSRVAVRRHRCLPVRLSFFRSGRLVARNAARARARIQGLGAYVMRSEERMDERPVDNFRPTRPSFQCTQKG